MKIISGPEGDEREVEIKIPANSKRIGIMLSGGSDSAILTYMLCLENLSKDQLHELVPFTVPRSDGAWDHVGPIISMINDMITPKGHHPLQSPIMVGDATLHHSQQAKSGELDAWKNHGVDHIFYGSQSTPSIPIKAENPARPDRIHYVGVTCPFALVDKRHTLDLYRRLDAMPLLKITHSCTQMTRGCCGWCFNCEERRWAAEALGIVDSVLSQGI